VTSTHDKPAPLTPDQVRAFEDILAVFNTPGWAHLAKQLEKDSAALADVRNCTDLPFAKGQLQVIDTIRRWPDIWNSIYTAAVAGDVEVTDEAFE